MLSLTARAASEEEQKEGEYLIGEGIYAGGASTVDLCKFFKREHQCVRSTAAMPKGLDGLVELVYQCETGKHDSHTLRLLQRDAHVFDEMFDKKSWVEVALQNSRRQIVQGPTGGCAATDRFEHAVQIEPRLVAIEQTLADTDHRTGDHDLVAEFCLLPGAGPSLMDNLFPQ